MNVSIISFVSSVWLTFVSQKMGAAQLTNDHVMISCLRFKDVDFQCGEGLGILFGHNDKSMAKAMHFF